MQENKPILIVGLGNPGDKYKNTRHNVGFIAVRHFVPADTVWRTEHNALTCSENINGRRVMFVLPQTFMNNSGVAVGGLMRFYKIPIENLIVIHDDMDLPVGKLKAKIGGGAGGHNGLKSIDAAITPNYNRIRIGVGHPQGHGEEVVNYVLGGFSKTDKETINHIIELVAETLPILIEKGMASYSNLIGMKQII